MGLGRSQCKAGLNPPSQYLTTVNVNLCSPPGPLGNCQASLYDIHDILPLSLRGWGNLSFPSDSGELLMFQQSHLFIGVLFYNVLW